MKINKNKNWQINDGGINMGLDYTYKCNEYGKNFKEPHTILYQEYPGASYQEDYVSPCCHSTFEEVE